MSGNWHAMGLASNRISLNYMKVKQTGPESQPNLNLTLVGKQVTLSLIMNNATDIIKERRTMQLINTNQNLATIAL